LILVIRTQFDTWDWWVLWNLNFNWWAKKLLILIRHTLNPTPPPPPIAWWMYENLVISSLNDRQRCKSTQFFHTQYFISKSIASFSCHIVDMSLPNWTTIPQLIWHIRLPYYFIILLYHSVHGWRVIHIQMH
jgi:hypothetical protein